MTIKLPLPQDFFQCPRLTPLEIEQLTQHAVQSAMDVVRKTHLNGTIQWTLRNDDDDGLCIYKGDDPAAKPGATLFMSVIEVPGTLDEVIELFSTRTTAQIKAHMQRFGNQLLDAVKLYSIVEPTAASPTEMIGMTWRAYKGLMSMVVAKRDACLLECNHAFTLDGRQGWVASTKSIQLSCCPELTHLGGFIRLLNYGSGHVFLESETRPGYIEMRYVAQLDLRGVAYDYVSDTVLHRRAWLTDINLAKRCRNLRDIDLFLREDRLRRGDLLDDHQLVPKASRAHCFICTVRFGWTHHKSNCMKCGEVVCSKCNHEWTLTSDGDMQRHFKACTKCAAGPQTMRRTTSCSSFSTKSSIISDECWDFERP
ncbi:Aste57867_667 [Aphanomyces stellatus]|uniref:Aste57867_667 protein n=1 Tax=Aphanomyces stellatus TaxID=120398 RepID=A0A485K5V5_9STRA|nr:hypothetical protein As57867_000666 [Aphanomyces stellatus]VFT77892.1 Aste57867_667 [Aphanomyces stellatus]